uniref:START domain-containing protein n=1 Tax=Angiostrongylus cantonensis TaxID=6313 RepID=A0A0K0D2F2_ANGCA
MAHQAFHPSGVSKLVPDLSGRIAALARYIGRPPRVTVKARYAFNHLQRCLMKSDAWRIPQGLINAESFLPFLFISFLHLISCLLLMRISTRESEKQISFKTSEFLTKRIHLIRKISILITLERYFVRNVLFSRRIRCLFFRLIPGQSGMYEYKCVGTYNDISASFFLDVQNDLAYRKEWDRNVMALELLKEEDEHELIRWVQKYPYPLRPREYVYTRRTWISDDSRMLVVDSEVVPAHVSSCIQGLGSIYLTCDFLLMYFNCGRQMDFIWLAKRGVLSAQSFLLFLVFFYKPYKAK